MPTRVEVPNHGIVEFPDGMSPDEISSAIISNFPDLSPNAPAEPAQATPTPAANAPAANLFEPLTPAYEPASLLDRAKSIYQWIPEPMRTSALDNLSGSANKIIEAAGGPSGYLPTTDEGLAATRELLARPATEVRDAADYVRNQPLRAALMMGIPAAGISGAIPPGEIGYIPPHDPTEAQKVAAGLQNAAADLTVSLADPKGLALILGGGPVARLGAAYFAGDMIRHFPEQVEEAEYARLTGDTQGAVRGYGGVGATSIFAPALGRAALPPSAPPAPAPRFSPEVEAAALLREGVTPQERIGVAYDPNAVRQLPPEMVDRLVTESGRRIITPEPTALESLRDLLEFQRYLPEGSPARALVDARLAGAGPAMGGKISFAAPAEAGAIPSARQQRVEPMSTGERLDADLNTRIAELENDPHVTGVQVVGMKGNVPVTEPVIIDQRKVSLLENLKAVRDQGNVEAPAQPAKAQPQPTPEPANPATMAPDEYRLYLIKTEGHQAQPRNLAEGRAQGAIHKSYLDEAIKNKQPISARAADKYYWEGTWSEGGVKLPQGYVREGNRYVYKATEPAPKSQSPAPRARRGKTLREIREQLDKQPGRPGEEGFFNPEIFQGVVDAGRSIYRTGMDFAKWSAEMVKQLGDRVGIYLKQAWDAITQYATEARTTTEAPRVEETVESGAQERIRLRDTPADRVEARPGEAPTAPPQAGLADTVFGPDDLSTSYMSGGRGTRPSVTETLVTRISDRLTNPENWIDLSKRLADADAALTESADAVGYTLRAEGAQALPKLKAALEAKRALLAEGKALMAAGQMEAGAKLMGWSQFFTEAIEAATLNSKTKQFYSKAKNPPIEIPASETAFDSVPSIQSWKAENQKQRLLSTGDASTPKSEPLLEVESVVSLDPASGSPLVGIDALINRLEAAKLPLGGKGVYSLPHPDAIAAIGKTVWNGSINIAIGALKAGKAIGVAIEEALTYLRHNANLNKDQLGKAKDNLAALLAAELGRSGPRPPAEPPVVPQTSPLETESVKMRKLSERGTSAPQIPNPVRERISTSPESYYRQQSVRRVEQAVRAMTDEQLSAVAPDSEIYTAAKLELANRHFERGQDDAGYNIFSELSQDLTRKGQVINQAKLLHSLNPQNVVKVINRELAKAGRDPLTPQQSEQLVNASKTRMEAQRELDRATDAWEANPTDANAQAAERALVESNKAALAEQAFVHKFQVKSMAGLLKAILQGNLLTPISEIANIFGNLSFIPFRGSARTAASAIDAIDATLRNRPRQIAVAPVEGSAQAAKGAVEGIKQIPAILRQGTGSVIKGEKRASLHPVEAWVKLFAKNPEMPTVGGKVPFADRVKLLIEGTFGVPAEAMLRGLAAGDAPFIRANESRIINEQFNLMKAKLEGADIRTPVEEQLLRNLSAPNARNMARKFPELFFDAPTMRLIKNETAASVFQRASDTLRHVSSLMGKPGSWADLAWSFVAPYKLTPWNIIGEILSYNPAIAALRSAVESKRGNIRAAEMNAGKMFVGGMLTAAGWWLYQKGLLAPSMDQRDEAQKARILAGEVLPPNHINISGLKRALTGGDPAFQPGDETRDIYRAGGLAGSMFYMTANIGRELERKNADPADIGTALLKNSTLEQARFGVNQSFLKGVSGILQAVTTGEVDTFLQGFENAVLSIPLPNTLSTLSRAERDYKVNIRDDDFLNEAENILRTRIGFTGADDELPLKRDPWGEPIRETPEGRNPVAYHFFDIFKGRQVTDDPVPLELYRLWRKTADSTVVPSLPDQDFTFGRETYRLTPQQLDRYGELVGKQRRQITEMLVVNPEYHKLSDENKVRLLNRVYQIGLDQGRAYFWMEHQGQLTPKAEKPGFVAQ